MHELTDKIAKFWGNDTETRWKKEDKIITDWLKEKAIQFQCVPVTYCGNGEKFVSHEAINNILGIAEESLEEKLYNRLKYYNDGADDTAYIGLSKSLARESKNYYKEHPEELKEE